MIRWDDGRLIVDGDLDLANAGEFRLAVDDAHAQHRDELVIDMRRCTLCGSSCLAVIVHALRLEMTVIVRHPTPVVLKALEIAGLDELVTIDDT